MDLPLRGAMEASLAELGTDRVFMSLRTQLGAVFLSSSEDGGDTWSLPQTTGLKAPESGTCLRRVPDTDTLLLILRNDSIYEPAHHHFGRRRPLSMAVSTDECRSWRHIGDIAGGDYELTNIGCTFTTAGNAVVTYLQVEGPGLGTLHENRHRPPGRHRSRVEDSGCGARGAAEA